MAGHVESSGPKYGSTWFSSGMSWFICMKWMRIRADCRRHRPRLGQRISRELSECRPFPYSGEEFLPSNVLEICLKDFPAESDVAEQKFDRHQERQKESVNPDIPPPTTRQIFYSFNSRPFIHLWSRTSSTGRRSKL